MEASEPQTISNMELTHFGLKVFICYFSEFGDERWGVLNDIINQRIVWWLSLRAMSSRYRDKTLIINNPSQVTLRRSGLLTLIDLIN